MSHVFIPTDFKQPWKKIPDPRTTLDDSMTNHDHLVFLRKGPDGANIHDPNGTDANDGRRDHPGHRNHRLALV